MEAKVRFGFKLQTGSLGSVTMVRFPFSVRFRRFGSDMVRTVGTGPPEPKANRGCVDEIFRIVDRSIEILTDLSIDVRRTEAR